MIANQMINLIIHTQFDYALNLSPPYQQQQIAKMQLENSEKGKDSQLSRPRRNH
jgi:hypothetical protein